MATRRGPTSTRSGMASRRVAKIVEHLQSQGQRMTVARRAVVEALANHRGHPNVDEVYAAVEAKMPGVHLATVYRTLDTLAELGVVSHVHLGHGQPVYHLQEPGRTLEHLHAQCRICKSIIDLPSDVLAEARVRLADDQTFTLDESHIALSGLCSSCNRTGSTTDE